MHLTAQQILTCLLQSCFVRKKLCRLLIVNCSFKKKKSARPTPPLVYSITTCLIYYYSLLSPLLLSLSSCHIISVKYVLLGKKTPSNMTFSCKKLQESRQISVHEKMKKIMANFSPRKNPINLTSLTSWVLRISDKTWRIFLGMPMAFEKATICDTSLK